MSILLKGRRRAGSYVHFQKLPHLPHQRLPVVHAQQQRRVPHPVALEVALVEHLAAGKGAAHRPVPDAPSGRKSTAGVVGAQPAAVIAFDEMWTYRQARRRGKRQDVWVWTAVVSEADDSRCADFDIGNRSEQAFLRLYERQPAARLYGTYAYRVYGWLPADRHQVGKGGAVNWNEGLHSWCRGQLNRLHRRTKGYTKSVTMLGYSPALLLAE